MIKSAFLYLIVSDIYNSYLFLFSEINLDRILDEMTSSDSDDEDDEEFNVLKSKMKNLGFFNEPNRYVIKY